MAQLSEAYRLRKTIRRLVVRDGDFYRHPRDHGALGRREGAQRSGIQSYLSFLPRALKLWHCGRLWAFYSRGHIGRWGGDNKC